MNIEQGAEPPYGRYANSTLVLALPAMMVAHVALAQTPPGSVGIEEAPAAAPAKAEGPRILVGALVGIAPDYEGSNDYEAAFAPLASGYNPTDRTLLSTFSAGAPGIPVGFPAGLF